jgi:nucleoid-associated protein YgaU
MKSEEVGMKRFTVIVTSLLIVLFLSGCMKTSTYQVERKDQALVGNRGIIQGEVPPDEPDRKRSRTITAVDIELPPSKKYKDKKVAIAEGRSTGKRDEAPRERLTEEELLGVKKEAAQESKKGYADEQWVKKEEPRAEEPRELTQKAVVKVTSKTEVKTRRYKVQSGDTLEKIAKKFYGKASKWPVIFEANKRLIKEPSRIYPGQEIVIPPLPKEEKREESDSK